MMMRTSLRRLAFILLLAIAVPWSSLHAQSSDDDEVVILFLVDQSGSMGGDAYGLENRPPNDPLDLRFEAVQYALATLSDYRRTIAPNTNIQMAVINFGDVARLSLDWTPIAASADWDTLQADLIDQLSADEFLSGEEERNLGNTDFLDAFRLAQQTFNRLPNTGQTRAMIILTDGQPCAPDRMDCGVASDEQNEMDDLTAFSDSNFPPSEYEIFVLAIDQTGDLWNERQDDWETITRNPARASRVMTSDEVGSRFLQILSELIATEIISVPAGEDFPIEIPPYTSEIRISLFKATTDPGSLMIRQPDGTQLSDASPNVTVTNRERPIEVWNIVTPIDPGMWVFRAGSVNDELSVFLELIPIQVSAMMPAQTLNRFNTAEFSINITDSGGNPIPRYDAPYTLNVDIRAILPDGSVRALTSTERSENESVFESSVALDQPGTYTITLDLGVSLPDGSIFSLFSDDNLGTITATDVRVEADNLPTGEYKIAENQTTTVRVLDGNDQLSTLPGLELRAIVSGPQSQTLTPEEMETGRYEITIPFERAGSFEFSIEARISSDGEWQPIDSSSFVVADSELVYVELVNPEDGATVEQSSGLPYIDETSNSFTVLVQTRRNTGDALIDVESLSQIPNTKVLIIEIEDGSGNRQQVQYETTANPGEYIVVVNDLDNVGDWEITARLEGRLEEQFVIDPTRQIVTHIITVEPNPQLLLVQITGGSGVLLLLATVIVSGTRIIRRRQHPCVGELQIVTRTDSRRGTRDNVVLDLQLDAKKSNNITLKRNALKGLPKDAGIQKITIQCPNEPMHSKKQVQVTVFQKRGKTAMRNRLLSPGTEIRVPITGLSEEIFIRKDFRSRRRR